MKYDVDYFINKFEAIPEEQWCTGAFSLCDENENTQHCALGHCGYGVGTKTVEGEALISLFEPELLPMINDDRSIEYSQSTPKQRILAALYDIKKSKEQS